MADFRKWLLAFAVVALLFSLGTSPAYAQPNQAAFSCVANAGVPPLVRAEGITELVGDLILNCNNGTPTPAGQPIPLSNVQIFLNTNVTSRLYTGNISEAIMTIDEPYPFGQAGNSANPGPPATTPGVNAPLVQTGCQAINSLNCAITGTGGGVGNTGPYNGVAGQLSAGPHYNVFQGSQNGASQVVWLGVPIDAPGTTGTRVIRITNVRANACQLGVSSTLIPTQIVMFIAVNGSQQVTINNPQQTVAFIQPGLVVSAKNASFVQCNNLNGNLVSSSASIGQTGSINVKLTEGFGTSFKVRNYGQIRAGGPNGAANTVLAFQNVLGFPYNTESGYVSGTPGVAPNGLVAGAVGLADTGTQFAITVNNIGAGVSIFMPGQALLCPAGTTCAVGNQTGLAVLVGGSGAGNNQITVSGNTATAVYEVLYSNPNVVENLTIPVTPAFLSNTGQNLPGLGQATASASFNPISSVQTASSTAPIPRFCNNSSPANLFSINPCTCNLLFPFVTNQAGFDTGIAEANTSLDPFGTGTQQGTVTIYYFGNTVGGGAAPPTQVSQVVPAGQELIFNLSSGGGFGVQATPGFSGYIITTARFQYCHAFAFISDLGAQRLAEGYLALQLDGGGVLGGIPRTGLASEQIAH